MAKVSQTVLYENGHTPMSGNVAMGRLGSDRQCVGAGKRGARGVATAEGW